MGAWGAGLYASDTALDLRSSIASLARLPLDGEQIVSELQKSDTCSSDPSDEEYTTFWLVTADQLARRGIAAPTAIARALEIIDSGSDIAMMRELGMAEGGLRQRTKLLTELADKPRAAPPVTEPRKVLRKPQPYLLEVGSLWAFPTCRRHCRNPYFKDAADEQFEADGWGAMIVLARGRAFGYLAWYAVAPIGGIHETKPALNDVLGSRFHRWSGYREPSEEEAIRTGRQPVPIDGGCGKLTRIHMKRMAFEPLGAAAVKPDWWQSRMRNARWADSSAMDNVSIANHLRFDEPPTLDIPVAEALA